MDDLKPDDKVQKIEIRDGKQTVFLDVKIHPIRCAEGWYFAPIDADSFLVSCVKELTRYKGAQFDIRRELNAPEEDAIETDKTNPAMDSMRGDLRDISVFMHRAMRTPGINNSHRRAFLSRIQSQINHALSQLQ